VETTVKTLPKLSPVIPLEAKPITKGEVKIIFRPHPNERVSSYIIQRYDDKNAKWKTIATLSPRLNVEYIDKNLQDGKIYKYRIFAKSFDNILSYPSNVIVVSTFKRPPVITNLKATINLPKEIKLTWTPVKDAAYYKIYISNSANGPFEFYKSTKSTVFIDKINKDGFIRYYKVTAVSPHKTESLLNESPVVMGETLPAPAQPIVSSSLNGNQVELVFTSPDNRAAKYLIIRKEKIGLFKYQTKKFIVNKNNFIDTINPKKEYIYYVYEVDKHGLISKKPAEITIGG
jgi:fibronectin type 3 domain-containing protein